MQSNNQKGMSTLSGLLLVGLVSVVTVAIHNSVKQEAKVWRQNKAKYSGMIGVAAYISRAEVLFNPQSAYCGQSAGACPGVYYNPVTCDPEKFVFHAYAEGPDWTFKAKAYPAFLVESQTTAIAKMSQAKEYRLELEGKKTTISANIGTITFNVPNVESASNHFRNDGFASNKWYRSDDQVTVEIEGVECATAAKIDALYTKVSYRSGNKTVSSQKVRIPLATAPTSCIIATGTNFIDIDQTSIKASMIANGAWREAYLPNGQRLMNEDPLEIDAAYLVFDDDVDIPSRNKCELYKRLDGYVYDASGSYSACYAYLYYNGMSVMDLEDDCPLKVSYIETLEAFHESSVSLTPPEPPSEPPEPIECPEPYITYKHNKPIYKFYIVDSKTNECVSVSAKKADIP